MSETEESANLAAKVEASDELTVSTTPPSGDNGGSAEAQDANVADDNALQNTSAVLRVTSSVDASTIPATDLSSNAPAQPAGENLMIDFSAFLNEYDYPKFFCSLVNYGMLQPDPPNDIQKYLDKTKQYGYEELRKESLCIQERLKKILHPVMVIEINNSEGENAIYEFFRRSQTFLNDDVAKKQAKKAHNFELEYLITNKLKLEGINQVDDQNDQKKWASVQYYENAIRFYKTANSGSTGGAADETNDKTSAESSDDKAVWNDVFKNVEQLVSGTSKDDLVGKDASSQSVIKSDQKNDPE